MVKKLVLFPVIFSINILAGETKLEFSDSKLNEVKFDKESNKPALQQFLEQDLGNAVIKAPGRNINILRVFTDKFHGELQAEINGIDLGCPGTEIPLSYHQALLKSDLLIAAVYREIILHNIQQPCRFLDLGEQYGFWQIRNLKAYSACERFSNEDIAFLCNEKGYWRPSWLLNREEIKAVLEKWVQSNNQK